jgi:thiol-disulfide isomerase/thioredoxin
MLVFSVLGWAAILIATYFILRPFTIGTPTIDEEDVTFYFFYTTWCGWSKKAWPHWNEFKRFMETRNVTYGGNPIKLVAIDAEQHPDMVKRFHVQGYPAFRLKTSEKIFEYGQKPSVEMFRAFLTRTLGYELVE